MDAVVSPVSFASSPAVSSLVLPSRFRQYRSVGFIWSFADAIWLTPTLITLIMRRAASTSDDISA